MSQWVVKPNTVAASRPCTPHGSEYGEQRAAERQAEPQRLKLHIIHLYADKRNGSCIQIHFNLSCVAPPQCCEELSTPRGF